jgi:predicted RNA-binding Zn-ribbon protein involved in translation (DUF1610 family)
MFEDKVREEGFEIFKKGLVRRLSPTHYVAKASAAEGWQLVELKHGRWSCDCEDNTECPHLYATHLHRSTSRLQNDQIDETQLKCRYCGSPDIARCGFRYNARGIARRYVCQDCRRKFSVPHILSETNGKPLEVIWLLNEVGMLVSKLSDLLTELSSKLDLTAAITKGTLSEGD